MADDIDIRLGVSGVDTAIASVARFGAVLSRLFTPAGLAVAAVGTALLGVGGAVVAVNQAIGNAEQMGNLAQKAGIAADELSQLGFAATLAESDVNAIVTASRALSQEMVKAGESSVGLRDKMLQVADEFARAADGAGKTARAVDLFGRSGQDLIPILNQGRAALEEQFRTAERLGVVIGPEFARQADEFRDNIETIGLAWRGVWLAIAREILPTLLELSKMLKAVVIDSELAANAGFALRAAFVAVAVAKEAIFKMGPALSVDELKAMFAAKLILPEITKAAKELFEVTKKPLEFIKPEDVRRALDLLNQFNVEAARGGERLVRENDRQLKQRLDDIDAFNIVATQKEVLRNEAILVHDANTIEQLRQNLLIRADLEQAFADGSVERWIQLRSSVEGENLGMLEGARSFMQSLNQIWQLSLQNVRGAFLEFAGTVLTTFSQGFGVAVANILTGAQKASEAFKALGRTMLASVIQFFAQLIINSLLYAAISAAISKTAFGVAIAQASALTAVNTAGAVAAAISSFGSALAFGPIAIAQVLAGAGVGAGLAATFGASGGAFHGGVEQVPYEGSFILSAGERVVQPAANEQLTEFLDSWQAGAAQAGDVYLDGQRVGTVLWQMSRDGQLQIAGKSVVS